MNPELVATAPAHDIARRKAEAHKRRNMEANDALNFRFGFHVLVVGEVLDAEGNVKTPGRAIHDPARCVHAVPCSRDYDPMPYPEAMPADTRMYEGTGIAALYGLPGGEVHAWQLAGWNVGRGGV